MTTKTAINGYYGFENCKFGWIMVEITPGNLLDVISAHLLDNLYDYHVIII